MRETSTRTEGHQPLLDEAQTKQAKHAEPETGGSASGPIIPTPYNFGEATEAEVRLELSEQQRRLLRADQMFLEFCRSNGWGMYCQSTVAIPGRY